MDIFQVEVEGGNFGDDMNEWFWDAVFPDYGQVAPDHTMFGIGSILWRKNFELFDKIVVMGSGSGYGVTPDQVPDNATIGWVRGPRTGRLMGVEPDRVITDPATLAARLPEFSDVEKTDEVIFMPHVGTARLALDWDGIASRAGVSYLSPANDSRMVIRRLAGARLVVTESLHGAILADAFRVPWVTMAISPTFTAHKFHDWAESMETDMRIFPSLGPLKALYGLKRRLSSAKGGGSGGGGGGPKMSAGDKSSARALFSRFAGPIGWMLARDIRAAMKTTPQLSDPAVLDARITAMQKRIDEIRGSFTPAA